MSSESNITIIQSLSHEGRGLTSIDGKVTFVDGALPNEKVILKNIKKHRRFNEAEVAEILTPSPMRVLPPCPHASICGGCSMQHIAMSDQIDFKTKIVQEQLQHFGKVSPEEWIQPIVGHTLGYRRKARLGVRYVHKKEKLLIGFREKSSNFLADIEQCLVLDPRIGTRLRKIADVILQLSCYTDIPQIEVAASDAVVALIFRHLKPLTDNDIQRLKQLGKDYQFDIWLHPNAPLSVHKIWPEHTPEKLSYFIPDHNIEMQFHPMDFTQVNHEINLHMIQQAIDLLDLKPEHDVLDLFCGLGNFTLPIARRVKQITGIEGSQDMVNRAKENAAHNQITNTLFFAENLMEPNKNASWLNKKYDRILLDPPRTGAKEIIPLLAQCEAERIVYVSCNPATFARDAGELVHTHGYHLTKIGVINMFPHTSHIEVIALFTSVKRKKSHGHRQANISEII